MNVVLQCRNIYKSYGKNVILNNFNYEFENTGLYVLYGESGSGKTTLLNIITGNTDYIGQISMYDKTFKNSVSTNDTKKYIAYITQNNYFVNYLTIYENLELCLYDKSDKNKIDECLEFFNLLSKKESFPDELSGGEQERISIIRALLQKKKILILDEPTSSLDKDNRKVIINILRRLKKDILIICATHDLGLLEIADKKIDFTNLMIDYKLHSNKYAPVYSYKTEDKKDSLFPYMLKKFIYKKREKKSTIFLTIIFIITILVINMCFDYETKVEDSLLNIHKINFVNYYCYSNDDYCESIIKKFNGVYNLYLYSQNVPDDIYIDINENYNTLGFNLTAKTLPYDSDLFPNNESYLEYGSYYEDTNDIIIGYDLAIKLSEKKNIPIKQLIDQEYEIIMPDKKEKFNIKGILKKMDNNDMYFSSLVGNEVNDLEFLNDKYLEKYKFDGIPGTFQNTMGKVAMRAYFDNIKDLKKFYNKYKEYQIGNEIEVDNFVYNFIEFKWFMKAMQYYLYPIIIVSFIISIMFYFETENIKNKYCKHILAIYNYYGYSWSNIIINNIFVSIIYVTCVYLISFILSLFLSPFLNWILVLLKVTNFTLFLPDYKTSLLLLILLIFLSILFSTINSLLLVKRGTLESIKEGDDFL